MRSAKQLRSSLEALSKRHTAEVERQKASLAKMQEIGADLGAISTELATLAEREGGGNGGAPRGEKERATAGAR